MRIKVMSMVWEYVTRWPPINNSRLIGGKNPYMNGCENLVYLHTLLQLSEYVIYCLTLSIFLDFSFYPVICLSFAYTALFVYIFLPIRRIIPLFTALVILLSLFQTNLRGAIGALPMLFFKGLHYYHLSIYYLIFSAHYASYYYAFNINTWLLNTHTGEKIGKENSHNDGGISCMEGIALLFILILFVANSLFIQKRSQLNFKYFMENINTEVQRKDIYFAGVIHELRNPLSSVLNCVSILNDTTTDIEAKELLELAENSGDILMSLIGEVLDVSKLQSGKLELDPIFCNIRELILKTLSLYYHKAKKKGIQLRLLLSSTLPQSAQLDATRLSQVMVNLLGNAIKFTEIGEIIVKVEWEKVASASKLTFSKKLNEEIWNSKKEKGKLVELNLQKQFEFRSYAREREAVIDKEFWKRKKSLEEFEELKYVKSPTRNDTKVSLFSQQANLGLNDLDEMIGKSSSGQTPLKETEADFVTGTLEGALRIHHLTSELMDAQSSTPDKRKEEKKENEESLHLNAPSSPTSEESYSPNGSVESGKFLLQKTANYHHMARHSFANVHLMDSINKQFSENLRSKTVLTLPNVDLMTMNLPKKEEEFSLSRGRTPSIPNRPPQQKKKSECVGDISNSLLEEGHEVKEDIGICNSSWSSLEGEKYSKHSKYSKYNKYSKYRTQSENIVKNKGFQTPRKHGKKEKEREEIARRAYSVSPTRFCPLNPVSPCSTKSRKGHPKRSSSSLYKLFNQEGILRIQVKDSGIGINEEDQKKLFQPFAQANNRISSKYGGSGLGLWLSQRISRLMGGDLFLHSKRGLGSLFTIKIPIHALDTNINYLAGRTFSFDYLPILYNPILIIEKDYNKQKLFASMFRSVGISFVIKDNVKDGVHTASQTKLAGIFMEVSKTSLPFHSKFLSQLQLQKDSITNRSTIIVAANWNDLDIKEKLYKWEIDYCVKKPINTKKLTDILGDIKISSHTTPGKRSYSQLGVYPTLVEEKEESSPNNSPMATPYVSMEQSMYIKEEIKDISNKEPKRMKSSLRLNPCVNWQMGNEEEPDAKMKIIIADDDYFANLTLKKLIENLSFIQKKSISIIKTQDGLQCLEEYKKHREIFLVIVDGNMPVMNGFECARKIRIFEEKNSLRPIYIVCISGDPCTQHEENFVSSGINEYITKPAGKKKLENMISSAYRMHFINSSIDK